MKKSALPFRQIEWWLLTLLFLAIILVNVLNAGVFYYDASDIQIAAYFAKVFIPLVMFLAFYLFHQKLLPEYLEQGKKLKFIPLSILVFFGSFTIVGAFSMGAEFTRDFLMPFYLNSVAVYAGYLVFVYILTQVVLPPKLKDFQVYNSFRLVAIYFFVLLFLFQYQKIAHHAILFTYAVILPTVILVILYNYFLIYTNRKQGKTQTAWAYYYGILIASTLIFISLSIYSQQPEFLLVGLMVIILIVLLVFPLSNLLFNKYDNFLSQINTLTYQVDQSSANLDFLRSQINPHFMFNALNTLYGTSLQENAERTSEGIQKLGDMMRFMLHENNQDKIPVEREKEYLINYVDLQLLRIKEQENIDIIFSKGEDACSGEIAPMLLIPFVENAFKHGISLQKKSWVKISLRCLAGSVHLDVNNSIHRSDDLDPERKSSGIGLENVRQRLNLLYPNNHELVIRENEMEYFVHLSIKL
jgi:two-component system, LytTR family, sensor kinase